MQQLLQMYKNENKIDSPFYEVVLSKINKKSKIYDSRILNLVIKEMPLDLYISTISEKIFLTEE